MRPAVSSRDHIQATIYLIRQWEREAKTRPNYLNAMRTRQGNRKLMSDTLLCW
jgi:hypothetical protein